MKSAAEKWLAERASPPGTIAGGLRGPAGQWVCHSLEEIASPDRREKILGQFDGLASALFTPEFSPRWTTWSFEQAQIRFVQRPDGWLLALVIRAQSDALPRLDPLSLEFLSVKLDD
jgi:hypothetical protein